MACPFRFCATIHLFRPRLRTRMNDLRLPPLARRRRLPRVGRDDRRRGRRRLVETDPDEAFLARLEQLADLFDVQIGGAPPRGIGGAAHDARPRSGLRHGATA